MNPNSKDPSRLVRTAFSTSRMLDFFSRKELTAQTGYGPRDWAVYVLKELLDNALDACEEAGVAPEIQIDVTSDAIAVSDNGPGIPPETVEGILDFTQRVSSREAYVAPDRGAQGNALKTILAVPFVLDGERGTVVIDAAGVRHEVAVRVDQIRQEPAIEHRNDPSRRRAGTEILVRWPHDSACSEPSDDDQSLQNDEWAGEEDQEESADPGTDSACSLTISRSRFLQIASDFTWLNPHLALTMRWAGEVVLDVGPSDPGWSKWRPSHPTSPHWYTSEQLARLAAAYIVHDRERGRTRLIREFLGEFDGLAGSAKQKKVLDATGLHREPLTALCDGDGMDRDKVEALLQAMKANTRPVRHQRLGIIGEAHLRRRFVEVEADMETFGYRKVLDEDADGRPEILEVAFAWCPELGKQRRLVTGVNWSPGIANPFRRLGERGRSLDAVLAGLYCGDDEEIVVFMHLVTPLAQYTDRGKSAIVLTEGTDR